MPASLWSTWRPRGGRGAGRRRRRGCGYDDMVRLAGEARAGILVLQAWLGTVARALIVPVLV